jgi:copper homeostasis protein CutC
MILPGGGINHSNARLIIDEWKVKRLHVGTCVREYKYGSILKESLI